MCIRDRFGSIQNWDLQSFSDKSYMISYSLEDSEKILQIVVKAWKLVQTLILIFWIFFWWIYQKTVKFSEYQNQCLYQFSCFAHKLVCILLNIFLIVFTNISLFLDRLTKMLDSISCIVCCSSNLTQYAHEVVLTSIQRRFNVMNIV